MRVFVAIDIPKQTQKEIKKIQGKIPEFKGKFTEAENLHLTLKFLGNIDEEKIDEIKIRLRNVKLKSFETEINKIGVFSPSFIKIVWIHLTNFEALQKIVDEKLSSLFPKEKRFMSHLTIARVKSVENKKEFLEELERIKFPEIKFKVKDFRLKKSTLSRKGPVYEDLEEYPLE